MLSKTLTWRRIFPVEVTIANPERTLLPGMIARVRLVGDSVGDTLVLPQDWLVSRKDTQGVFTIADDRAAWRPLELGEVIRNQVVVRSGLAIGDDVVIMGQRELFDGDPVMVVRGGVCCRDGHAVFDEGDQR